jgi:hypothetical protein
MEALLVAVVVAVGRKLGDRWLDAVAEKLDMEVRERLSALGRSLTAADEADSTSAEEREEAETARVELVQYLEKNPAAQAQLAQAALTTVGSAMIEKLESFLTAVFETVNRLPGGIVALPGALTGESCVTVIDARTTDRSELQMPTRNWDGPPVSRDNPSLMFGAPEWQPLGWGVPRMWIIGMENADERDDLVTKLNRKFTDKRERPDPVVTDIFLRGLEGVTRVGLVWGVYEDRVSVVDPKTGGIATLKDSDEERFYDITSPAGTRLLRMALVDMVVQAKKLEDDKKWDSALDPDLRPSNEEDPPEQS